MKFLDIDQYLYGIENIDELKILLDAGVDTNAKSKDRDGPTALMIATESSNIDIVKMLLDHDGTDVNIKDNNGRTALMYAEDDDIITVFLNCPKVDKNARQRGGETILLNSVLHDDMERVEVLLKFGVDVNIGDDRGVTPLMSAGSKKFAEILLKYGANINAQDNDGYTALIWAIEEDNIKIVKLLLENNSDINIKDNSGRTALMIAIEYENHPVIEMLKRHTI